MDSDRRKVLLRTTKLLSALQKAVLKHASVAAIHQQFSQEGILKPVMASIVRERLLSPSHVDMEISSRVVCEGGGLRTKEVDARLSANGVHLDSSLILADDITG